MLHRHHSQAAPVTLSAMRSIVLVLAVLVASCGNSSPSDTESRPGNPEVYERIAAETDCAELQASFDRAYSGPRRPWRVDYMEAADDRMREIGCYDD